MDEMKKLYILILFKDNFLLLFEQETSHFCFALCPTNCNGPTKCNWPRQRIYMCVAGFKNVFHVTILGSQMGLGTSPPLLLMRRKCLDYGPSKEPGGPYCPKWGKQPAPSLL